MNQSKYRFPVTLRGFVDGDTFDADVNLGFDVTFSNQRFRMYGIDAYETSLKRGTDEAGKAKGIEIKNNLNQIINAGTQLIIETFKDPKDKYGRYLAVVWIPQERFAILEGVYEATKTLDIPSTEVAGTKYRNLNEWMVGSGFAKRYLLE